MDSFILNIDDIRYLKQTLAWFSSLDSLDSHNQTSYLWECRDAIVIDTVVDEICVSLGFDEATVSQNFQVVRDGGLTQIKLIHNVANAQRFTISCQ